MIASTIRRRAVLATVISAAALLAACAQSQRVPAPQAHAIVGTVNLAEPVDAPLQSTLIVELHEIASAAAPAKVVGQTAIQIENLKPPYKFMLPTDTTPINSAAEYRVNARITVGNQTTYASDTAYPVLTRGAGRTADLTLVRVAP
ncbi:YbaY family lipoprotein [Acidovorax sp. CCYZU-2555]|uniref:YbaY family lipoprotein n=1 Tax=Acidovorax sp. CCYZU-2555 TaxID=2835042 RepID=UPI001BD0E117|nr:YbaY family lipoprotein [Acidovorax sp. CCYZU-2555]MBS7779015.1 YbaY family lipoprotein [Acidovorax sp. CCYZU-2555]